jgi:hypothetical protein
MLIDEIEESSEGCLICLVEVHCVKIAPSTAELRIEVL